MGSKKAKTTKGIAVDVIFKTYSPGIKTNRDAWAYNFNRGALTENIQRMSETYNAEVDRWKRRGDRTETNVDAFVLYDDTKISWSRDLKVKLNRGVIVEYTERKVKTSLYRPFTKLNLYFDRTINNDVHVFPSIFPTPIAESENRVICVSGIGSNKTFQSLIVDVIPDVQLVSNGQCFPFYTYDEDGTNRQENITDWALTEFRTTTAMIPSPNGTSSTTPIRSCTIPPIVRNIR